MKERRGRVNSVDGIRKGRLPKLDKRTEEEMIAENHRLWSEPRRLDKK